MMNLWRLPQQILEKIGLEQPTLDVNALVAIARGIVHLKALCEAAITCFRKFMSWIAKLRSIKISILA